MMLYTVWFDDINVSGEYEGESTMQVVASSVEEAIDLVVVNCPDLIIRGAQPTTVLTSEGYGHINI